MLQTFIVLLVTRYRRAVADGTAGPVAPLWAAACAVWQVAVAAADGTRRRCWWPVRARLGRPHPADTSDWSGPVAYTETVSGGRVVRVLRTARPLGDGVMLQVTIDGPVVCSGFTPDGGYLRRRRRMVVACRYSDERAGAATDLKSSGEPVFASVDWTVRTGGVHVASNTTLEGMFTGASAPRRW